MQSWILLYDGGCGMCRGSLPWVHWLDRSGRVATVPFQAFDFSKRPDLSLERCQQRMHLLLPDGRVLAGGAAVRKLLRLRWVGWPAGALCEAPIIRNVFDYLYDVIARHRHALSGGACTLPPRRDKV